MVFTRLNQTFAFHASPEDFISSRLQELAVSEPDLLPSSGEKSIIRASILNRSVHVVTSYQLCKEILHSDGRKPSNRMRASNTDENLRPDAFAVGPAYRELMSDWFPAPNILMEDGLTHAEHKQQWREQLSTLPSDAETIIREIARTFIKSTFIPGTRLDLYESLKALSWDLILGVFLGLGRTSDQEKFSTVETAQEALLRGQFSLFPISINTRFWQSARSKGLKARQDLQVMLAEHIEQQEHNACPLLHQTRCTKPEISSHCLLFTSSIVNKALSSLLTAVLANLFLMPGEKPLAALLRSQTGQSREATLRSILLETERFSPPEIGVMRRVQQDVVLSTGDGDSANHHVPAEHDVWLYLSGANRDETVFEDAERFHFDRFMHEDGEDRPHGFGFGAGPKACLGLGTVRRMLAIVAQELIEAGIDLEGVIDEMGVKGWLGWAEVAPSAIAKDLKQLPSQRPRNPIMVTVRNV
jgi:cytochrome P450